MFKGLGNIASLMKQAQEMQGRMAQMQESLRNLRIEGSAGGGMVTVVMNGQQQVLDCHIEKSLLADNDPEIVEDLIVAAVNQALEKTKQTAAEEMSKLTGGMDLSGVGDMLSKLGLGK